MKNILLWSKNNWLLLIMLLLIVMATSGAFILGHIYYENYFILISEDTLNNQVVNLASIGDFFGGILNPFFAFLGLLMLLITLFQNQKELILSRKEFKESKEALEEQSKTQKLQQFENTFFNLLKKFNFKIDNSSSGESDHSNIRYKKFEKMRYELYDYHKYYCKDDENTTSNYSYIGFYKDPTKDLSDYFNSLFFIIDFIENNNLEDDKKNLYLKILFNDLTYNEIFFIFYHIISDDKYLLYKNIIEQNKLLDRINYKSLIHPCIDLLKYNLSAYGNNESIRVTIESCKKKLNNKEDTK